VLPSPAGSDCGPPDVVVPVADPSGVGEARRVATALARRLGFDDAGCGRGALVVTEAAGNMVKHAGGGEILLRGIERGGVVGLDVLALDRGPGMTDPSRCLGDGFSTAGTPGTGLGAIARQASLLDLYTSPGAGTALLSRIWARQAPPASGGLLEVGVVHLPRAGEEVCGDGWAVEQQPGRCLILVADGLGHGPQAADAARAAVRIFREHAGLDPVEIVRRIHAALRSTRGAAVAVAEVRPDAQELRYVGVGNIAGTVFAEGASRSAVSHNGTAGGEARKIQEFAYPFPKGAVLVMHSDGLATSWRLEQYAGLAARDPGLVAAVLYRDFNRGRDDVTVLAAREEAAANP
jgi:anti-sigma regulatory factor (Ser/Thr protein kinase)